MNVVATTPPKHYKGTPYYKLAQKFLSKLSILLAVVATFYWWDIQLDWDSSSDNLDVHTKLCMNPKLRSQRFKDLNYVHYLAGY